MAELDASLVHNNTHPFFTVGDHQYVTPSGAVTVPRRVRNHKAKPAAIKWYSCQTVLLKARIACVHITSNGLARQCKCIFSTASYTAGSQREFSVPCLQVEQLRPELCDQPYSRILTAIAVQSKTGCSSIDVLPLGYHPLGNIHVSHLGYLA